MSRPLDSDWFKEDRELPVEEQQEAKQESEKVIRNSTFVVSRLQRIMQEDLDKTLKVSEDFDDPAWERKTIAAAAERKVLRRLIKLLP